MTESPSATAPAPERRNESEMQIQKRPANAPPQPIIEEPPPESAEEVEPTLFDYLTDEKGHGALKKALDIWASHMSAETAANAEAKKVDHNYRSSVLDAQNKNFKFLMKLRGCVFVVALVAAGVLAYLGKFDGAMGTLIGTLVGYFLGKADRT